MSGLPDFTSVEVDLPNGGTVVIAFPDERSISHVSPEPPGVTLSGVWWGIDSLGRAYIDPAGPDPGDEAVFGFDPAADQLYLERPADSVGAGDVFRAVRAQARSQAPAPDTRQERRKQRAQRARDQARSAPVKAATRRERREAEQRRQARLEAGKTGGLTASLEPAPAGTQSAARAARQAAIAPRNGRVV